MIRSHIFPNIYLRNAFSMERSKHPVTRATTDCGSYKLKQRVLVAAIMPNVEKCYNLYFACKTQDWLQCILISNMIC